MFTCWNAAELEDCLRQIPPVELLAVTLLREQRQYATGGWCPTVPPECVAEATQELIAYTQACAALVDRLHHLSPVTLSTLESPSWPL